ncbi:hypothetical protein ACFL1R_03765 [Candidatus Latescibacterota bacterium]
MRLCNKAFLLFVMISTFLVLSGVTESASAVEFVRGAALRQNVIMFRLPSGMNRLIFPDKSFGISETRARLISGVYSGNFVFNGAVDIRTGFMSSDMGLFGGSMGGGSLFGQGIPLERWDLTANHVEESTTSLLTRLDRLNIMWRHGSYDVIVGRQPVSLGTSHFVGILDVVAPFAPGDLDTTYKPGVDAVRVRRGVGMTGEAEIIVVGAREWKNSALLGRFRSSFSGIDLEFIGGRFRDRSFSGFGWEGGAGSLGLWGELALFERKKAEESWRGGWSEAAFSGIAGVDVSIADNTILGGALMFQDFGVRRPEDLASVYTDAPFREGWMFLGSASYGVMTLHRQLHPLVNGDLASLINLIDGSTLWQPVITISTGDNTDLALYGWIGTGEKSASGGSIRSEFGMMPDGGGFYARWFF